MSRADYDGWDGEYDSQRYLWQSWLRRAIKGKRGQAALREIEAALLALPNKRLIADELCERDYETEEVLEVCTLGALALARQVELPYGRIDGDILESTEFAKSSLKLAWSLGWTIAEKNDDGPAEETPEQRYERMLAWVRSQIAVPA